MKELTKLPKSKQEIAEFKNNVRQVILSEKVDPLEALKRLKIMEKAIADTLRDKDINKAILKKAIDDHGESVKTFTAFEVEFNVREVGVSYDFSVCGDSYHDELTEKLNQIKEDLKDREAILKAINPNQALASSTTGEELRPPKRTSTTKVTVKL